MFSNSVMQQKKESYADLTKALEVMRYIDDKTPKSKIFYAMYLLETRQLTNVASIHVNFEYSLTFLLLLNNFYNFQKDSPFPLIADVVLNSLLDVNEVEAYFISKNLFKCSEEISRDMANLKLLTSQTLEKEDADLYK